MKSTFLFFLRYNSLELRFKLLVRPLQEVDLLSVLLLLRLLLLLRPLLHHLARDLQVRHLQQEEGILDEE